ncbi:MAG: hypothetical protein ABI024_06705 [Vicinamibacterales bacterium]
MAIDQVIEYFNARRMDLPDGFFDRRTQFVINGTPFETLLSAAPNDPLIMMLARGPAGFRFTAKALQHGMPDAKLERGEVTGDASTVTTSVWLSGKLRGTGGAVNTLAVITLRLAQAGHVEIAEAVMDPTVLRSIQEARLRA